MLDAALLPAALAAAAFCELFSSAAPQATNNDMQTVSTLMRANHNDLVIYNTAPLPNFNCPTREVYLHGDRRHSRYRDPSMDMI